MNKILWIVIIFLCIMCILQGRVINNHMTITKDMQVVLGNTLTAISELQNVVINQAQSIRELQGGTTEPTLTK